MPHQDPDHPPGTGLGQLDEGMDGGGGVQSSEDANVDTDSSKF